MIRYIDKRPQDIGVIHLAQGPETSSGKGVWRRG